MIGPFTRISELRHLVDEVAVVDWSDRSWWAILSAAAAAETLAGLRHKPQRVALPVHGGGLTGDTYMAWPALPPRNLAEAVADAIVEALAAVRALDELDGRLIDQPLRVALEVGRAGAELVACDPARVRFAVAGRWMDARFSGEVAPMQALARELARFAIAPRGRERHGDALPAAIAAVIGNQDPSIARHLHRHTWTAAGGPWLGLGRAGVLAMASTCHRVVDGYGHALIAGRLATALPGAADLHRALASAAHEVVGDAPVPALPAPADTQPLGIAWTRIGGRLPRFAHLAHGLGCALWTEASDRHAPVSPVIQVPVAPGAPGDPDRWRRRVIYTLLSVRFHDGHPEPVAAFAERAAVAVAREIEGRGLLSRLLGAQAAAPVPAVSRLRSLVDARPGWLSSPIDVLAGWSSLSKLQLAPGDDLAPSLVAVSSPSRVLEAGHPRSTSTITIVGDAAGATITVAGTGRAGTRRGAQELLDAFLARTVQPE